MRRLAIALIPLLMLSFVVGVIGCDDGDESTPTPVRPGVTEVTGSGHLEAKEFNLSGFTSIAVAHAFQVDITRADSFFVSITLDDNLFEHLNIKKMGDDLLVGLEPNITYRKTTQRATIALPDLRGLELSGASKGDISGFSSAHSLQLETSGASSLSIENVEAGDTRFNISGASRVSGDIEIADGDFDVSGASTVELEGTAHYVLMHVSGASTMRLADFAIANAGIELSGASNATVNASGELDIDVSGVSRLDYLGNPTLGTVSVSGDSTMRQK
jgi:hypothetical protein